MAVLFSNNASSNLSASITSTATSLSVTAGTGGEFPNPGGADYFYATLSDAAGNIEIIKVTARSLDTLTVVRGQDGTTARAWANSDKIELRLTAGGLSDLKNDTLALVNNGQLTVSAGSGLSGSGTFLANQAGNTSITISHADTSSQASVSNTGATVVQSVTVDDYGHVTAMASKTMGYADVGAPSTTGTNASGTWGINITGSAGSVSGLTLTSSANGINPDSVTQNQIGYNTSVSLFGQTDGGLYSSAYSSSWIHQIYGDFRTGQIAIRGKNSGTWQAWRTVLDSSNYTSYAAPATHYHDRIFNGAVGSGNYLLLSSGNELEFFNSAGAIQDLYLQYSGSSSSLRGPGGNVILHAGNYSSYAPTLTGGGASGTWGINVTGSAGSLANDTSPRVRVLTFTGEGGDSGNGSVATNYGIYQQGGAWSYPYPDLCIGFHTGIKIGAHYSYGGTRFYNNSDWATQIMSIGESDNNVRINNTLYSYAYRGNGNVAGTGEATYHPAGVYSTGTNWLYGTMYLNGNVIYDCGRMNGPWTSGSRCYSNEWIEFGNYSGLYSPNNGAHFYPNNLTYGAWRVAGSRNGWNGLEFDSGVRLMMNGDTHGFHNTTRGWAFLNEVGNGYFPGSVTAYWSDERLKTNLRQLGREALSILGGFRAHRYNWNEKVTEYNIPIEAGKEEIGLIAQHVQRTLADAVVVNKAANKVNTDGSQEELDYLTINYDRITPLLVEAANLHEEDIAGMKAKIAHLEALVAKLIGE